MTLQPEDGFRELIRQVPVAEGRLMAELAQNIERTSSRVEHKAGRGFFGRLVDRLLLRTRKADLQTDRDLVDHVRTLAGGLQGMRRHQALVDYDVTKVAGHLRTVQLQTADLADAQAALELLVECCERRLATVEDMVVALDHVAADHEQRIRVLEARDAADEAFARAVDCWEDGETYAELPWAVQVTLLAREVFGGPAGAYEALVPPVPGGPSPFRYREQLARTLGRHGPGRADWPERSLLVAPRLFLVTLEEVVAALQDDDERRMVAEILGVGLDPGLRVWGGPAEAALARTLQFATEPATRQRPHLSPAQEALTAAVGAAWMPPETDLARLVRRIVDEQAAGALRARRELFPALAEEAGQRG